MMNSGELINKYGGEQKVMEKPTKASGYIHYAQNEFKRFMGYEEPDYLRVAGLYASTESSGKSRIYDNFLVKKADYVAERLNWFTESGKPDVKRAERAIRSACRTKAPNGLYYMYTKSNKNKVLSTKGGSSIYMSGRRYQQLLDEYAKKAVTYSSLVDDDNQTSISNMSNEEDSDFDKARKMVRKLAGLYNFSGYDEGAVVWVTNHLLKEFTVEQIRDYFNMITGGVYCRQAYYNPGCPKINSIFDVYHKYDKIQRFMSDRRRHIVTPD